MRTHWWFWEGSSYFQKSGELVDSYVDQFRELSKRAELVDACTLVIKLRRGLLPYIAEALTDSSNPPASNDMEQWIKQARNFERSRQLQRNLARTKPSLPPPCPPNPLCSPPDNDPAIRIPHPHLARSPILFVQPDSHSHRSLRFRCLWMWTPPGLARGMLTSADDADRLDIGQRTVRRRTTSGSCSQTN